MQLQLSASHSLCAGPRPTRHVAPFAVTPRSAALVQVRASRQAAAARKAAPINATSEQVEAASTASETFEDAWIPVCRPEDLPKGVRKELEVDGRSLLMFWYRNQIYCIESRSPAEGAYSEGFIKAKFTQDFCIECPSTGSLFSLKDGSIVAWYPNNPVLRALTPSSLCRNLEIYPVRLSQEAISVDVSQARFSRAASRGGAGTSLEDNNVFTVQPTVYFEGMDPTKEAATVTMEMVGGAEPAKNPAVVLTGVFAVGATAVAGTAAAVYFLFTN